jgi:hypothetical protein
MMKGDDADRSSERTVRDHWCQHLDAGGHEAVNNHRWDGTVPKIVVGDEMDGSWYRLDLVDQLGSRHIRDLEFWVQEHQAVERMAFV